MRIALLMLSALLLALTAADAAFGRSGRRRMEVTCSQVKPQEICNGKNKGFQVTDGCNICTCESQPGRLTCSIKTCPTEDQLTDNRLKRRAQRYCAKLARKVQKRLRKFQRKAGEATQSLRWPIKCIKSRKLCRERPGATFFDGCNRCTCPWGEARESVTARCDETNVCPDFVGTRSEFKRRCVELGARIDTAVADDGRRGGRRRQQRRRQEGEGEGEGGGAAGGGVGSLVQRWLGRV